MIAFLASLGVIVLLGIGSILLAVFTDNSLGDWGSLASLVGIGVSLVTLFRIDLLHKFGDRVFHATRRHQEDRKLSQTLFVCESFSRFVSHRSWKQALAFGAELANQISALGASASFQGASIDIRKDARRLYQIVDDIRRGHGKPAFALTEEQWTTIGNLQRWLSEQDAAALERAVREGIDAQ